MAERGALSLLSLLCLTFLHPERAAAKHVDKGKGFLRTAASPLGSVCYSCSTIEAGKRREIPLRKMSLEPKPLHLFLFCFFAELLKTGCVFVSGALLTHPPTPTRVHKSTRFPTLCLLFAETGVFTPQVPVIAVRSGFVAHLGVLKGK